MIGAILVNMGAMKKKQDIYDRQNDYTTWHNKAPLKLFEENFPKKYYKRNTESIKTSTKK